MAATERLRTRGRKRARTILGEIAVVVRDARLRAGISQVELGRRVGVSGDKIWQIENDKLPSLSIMDACEICAVVGLDLAARTYPNGAKLRDGGQAPRLMRLAKNVAAPLKLGTEVPLPAVSGHAELRAWDALIEGRGQRTGVELETRITDLQDTQRRHNGKLRDDAVDHFLLVIADTRHNREVVAAFGVLVGIPRLRTASVLKALRAGEHPPTGYMLF